MAFEPQINEIGTKYNKRLETVKTQSNVSLSSSGEKIEKVLFAKAMPYVNNIITNTGSVVLEGGISANALVVLEGGAITALSNTGSFTATYNASGIAADSQILASVQNLGIDNIVVNDNTVTFSDSVGMELSLIEKQKVSYVTNIQTANQKIGTVDYSTLANAHGESFELNTEIDLPNSVSKVLLAESYGVLKDVTASNDLVTLNGELFTNLVYLTNDEQPKLKNQTYSTEFHQEILSTGTVSGQVATATLDTSSNEFEIQGELSSSKGVIILKNKFNSNIFVESSNTFDCVVDAFCPQKEMQMNLQSFVKQNIVCSKLVNDKVDGNIVLNEEDVRIDKVVATSAGFGVVNKTQVVDDEVVVQGTVYVSTIYLLDDEAHTIQAIQVEMPFETSVRCEGVKTTDNITAKVVVKETESRNKKSKEIDVLADIAVGVVAVREDNGAVVSGIVMGEDRKPQETNMGMYVIQKAEDAWEISKNLLVSPEMLIQQNPSLTFPVTKPTQIIVYRQQIIE